MGTLNKMFTGIKSFYKEVFNPREAQMEADRSESKQKAQIEKKSDAMHFKNKRSAIGKRKSLESSHFGNFSPIRRLH